MMEPVLQLSSYPRGLLVLHEENLKLGRRLGASSKYIHAVHPRTMDYLDRLWRDCGWVDIDDLVLGDSTSVRLAGSDTVGVCLDSLKALWGSVALRGVLPSVRLVLP
jgi:hypothetical protein